MPVPSDVGLNLSLLYFRHVVQGDIPRCHAWLYAVLEMYMRSILLI